MISSVHKKLIYSLGEKEGHSAGGQSITHQSHPTMRGCLAQSE